MSSIDLFGYGWSKITTLGTPDAVTTVLQYSKLVNPAWTMADILKRKDIIDGDREFILKGSHSEFQVIQFLTRMTGAKAHLDYLFDVWGNLVTFYPHRHKNRNELNDATPVKNSGGSNVNFVLTEVEPFLIGNVNGKDAVRLLFESTEYTDASRSLQ